MRVFSVSAVLPAGQDSLDLSSADSTMANYDSWVHTVEGNKNIFGIHNKSTNLKIVQLNLNLCQHIQDHCRNKCVTLKRPACDVGVTDQWAHWVKCKSLFCSPMWHLLSADDRLDDKDSLDIHDNPPLPDNVLKEEDNKVRRPISITCDASRGAVYSASTQDTNPLSFCTKLQINCFLYSICR